MTCYNTWEELPNKDNYYEAGHGDKKRYFTSYQEASDYAESLGLEFYESHWTCEFGYPHVSCHPTSLWKG